MSHWLVALFCMLLAVGPAVADDRANLIGTWKLAEGEIEFQDTGERRPLYGTDRMGYIIFTGEGRMMGIIEGDSRKAPQTDEHRARLLRTMVAYSGLYRLEGDKWVTAVDVAWNPAWIGTDQVREVGADATRKQSNHRMNLTALRAARYPGRWAERTDHEVTDAAPADEMAISLKALRATGACHARSRTPGYAGCTSGWQTSSAAAYSGAT
jgi:lipocalin-like protein